eukprot:2274647-Alexandrium_andersonii.AAC.1
MLLVVVLFSGEIKDAAGVAGDVAVNSLASGAALLSGNVHSLAVVRHICHLIIRAWDALAACCAGWLVNAQAPGAPLVRPRIWRAAGRLPARSLRGRGPALASTVLPHCVLVPV